MGYTALMIDLHAFADELEKIANFQKTAVKVWQLVGGSGLAGAGAGAAAAGENKRLKGALIGGGLGLAGGIGATAGALKGDLKLRALVERVYGRMRDRGATIEEAARIASVPYHAVTASIPATGAIAGGLAGAAMRPSPKDQ